MASRVVGIDLGAAAIWALAAERRGPRGRWAVVGAEVFAATEVDALVDWIGPGATVAIDSPGGPSERRHLEDDRVAAKFRPARCAEVGLRLHGVAVPWIAPGPDDVVPPWMGVGFDVWSAVGAGALEVFPFGAFTTLLGRRPVNKLTVAGHPEKEALDRFLAIRVLTLATIPVWAVLCLGGFLPLSGKTPFILFVFLTMAAVLGLPESLPYRNELFAMTAAVVVFTVLVQGTTAGPLVKRLGLAG